MTRLLLLCSTLLLASRAASAQAPLEGLLTRAELTGFRETTRYDEVMELAERLAARSSAIHLTDFGYTNEGRRLPLLVVGAPAPDPASVLATGKTRIYLQGNIHAGEVCGKEALLILLRQIASGEPPDWMDDLVLLVAPIYNADGNERIALGNRPRQNGPVGGMGTRANAQGLDLNRDHMKLDSPEARSLTGLLNRYDPHVVVDLHTTNGSYHAYHLTYSPPLHPATAPAIVDMLRERWLPEVTATVERRYGWHYYYYGNTEGPRPGWYTFDHRPRFNNNYVGLRNRFAILGEAYAYASFEDRVVASLRFVEEILRFASRNAREIVDVTAAADARSVAGTPLATRATFEPSAGPVEILMGAVEESRHPGTGEVVLRRLDVVEPTPMLEYGTFAAAETSVAPAGYYVLPEAAAALERLVAHGVRTRAVVAPVAVDAETFRIDSTAVASTPFQGHRERTVWGEWEAATRTTVPAGALYVPLDQPLGRLAFTLLEPRSDDGLLAWGFFDEQVSGGTVPVLAVRQAPER